MSRRPVVVPSHGTAIRAVSAAAVLLLALFHAPALAVNWTLRGPWWGPVGSIAFGPGPPPAEEASSRSDTRAGAPPLAVYAGAGITLYWSTNGGHDWAWRGAGLPAQPYQLIASATQPGLVLAGHATGVYRSTDYGATWAPAAGLSSRVIDFTVGHPGGVETFFAATQAGVFRSIDGGATWAGAGLGGLAVRAIEYQSSSGFLLASIGDGKDVRRSPDGGATWVSAKNGFGSSTAIYAFAAHPDSAGVFYAGGLGIGADRDLYKTVDSGNTWTGLVSPAFPQYPYVHAIAIDSGNSSRVVVGDDWGVFRSDDGGGTWQAAQSGPGSIPSSMVADPATPGSFLCGTQDFGIYATQDAGVSWVPQSRGLSGSSIYSMALHAPSGRIWASVGRGILLSTNNGADWSSTYYGDNVNAVTLDPSDPSRVFAATSNHVDGGSVMRSTDGGLHWSVVFPSANPYRPVYDVVVDPADPQFVFAQTKDASLSPAVVRSSDGGESWGAPVSLGAPGRLAFDPSNGQRLLAGTGSGLEESLDRGLSFHPVAAPAGLQGVTDVVFVPDQPSQVYVATWESGVWRSTDGGITFGVVNGGLGPLKVRRLALRLESSGHVLFAATENGVFKSVDQGDNWLDLSGGLPSRDVRAVAYHAGEAAVLVGLSGAGIWSSPDPGLVGVPEMPGRDRRILSVDRPWPNPMGSRGARISYRLSVPGRVRIVLVDVSGRRVREFAEVPEEAGPHSVQWDGRDDAGDPVASGVYMVRVKERASGEAVARWLVVLR